MTMLREYTYQIIGLLVFFCVVVSGCGKDTGTLEIEIRNSGTEVVQAVVRIDGSKHDTFPLNGQIISIDFDAGDHILGIEFLDGEGEVVGSHGPRIATITTDGVERILIDLRPRILKLNRALFEVTVGGETQAVSNTTVQVKGTKIAADVIKFTLTVEGEDSRESLDAAESGPIGAATFEEDSLILERGDNDATFKGNGKGRFVLYLFKLVPGFEIFEGQYTTAGDLRVVLGSDGRIKEFTHPIIIEAVGKGGYQGHTLKGSAIIESIPSTGAVTGNAGKTPAEQLADALTSIELFLITLDGEIQQTP